MRHYSRPYIRDIDELVINSDEFLDGAVIAGAEINYFSSPIPHYQITDIWVEHEMQGMGIGSELMEKIEAMLVKKGRAGFLVDAILDTNPATGFYERRGWIPVPRNKYQYVFNLPNGVSANKFMGIELRQTPVEDRR